MFKIGITGAESTGKTTLAKALRNHYSDSILINETARNFKKDDLRKCSMQYNILLAQLQQELICSGKNIVICDRTLADNLIYLTNICPNQNKNLFNLVRNWIETYDLIFFTSIEDIPFVDDGFRFMDNDLRNKIDHDLKEFYNNNYILHKVLIGNEEKRLETAIKIIDMVK